METFNLASAETRLANIGYQADTSHVLATIDALQGGARLLDETDLTRVPIKSLLEILFKEALLVEDSITADRPGRLKALWPEYAQRDRWDIFATERQWLDNYSGAEDKIRLQASREAHSRYETVMRWLRFLRAHTADEKKRRQFVFLARIAGFSYEKIMGELDFQSRQSVYYTHKSCWRQINAGMELLIARFFEISRTTTQGTVRAQKTG